MEHINRNRLSSAHVTFPLGKEVKQLRDMGWLTRLGVQYMWMNRGYGSFQDFESALLQRKRKSLRQERKRPTKEGLTVKRLRGDDIKAAHMDDFYSFYIDTTMRKFGMPYLTREFFHMLRERMADKVLLVMAEDSFGHSVAGALNLVGENAIFGRNWGMSPRSDSHKHLHFELCYYQAIEEAIEHGLDRVEAGAQGEHKIQRGYEPTFTHSAHFLRDEEFRQAIGQFVAREKEQMAAVKNFLFGSFFGFSLGLLRPFSLLSTIDCPFRAQRNPLISPSTCRPSQLIPATSLKRNSSHRKMPPFRCFVPGFCSLTPRYRLCRCRFHVFFISPSRLFWRRS